MSEFHATFNPDMTFNATFEDDDSSMNATFEDTQIIETGDYNKLANKPRINNEEVVGNKSFEDYGDHIMSNIEIKAVFDKVFRR